MRGAEMPLFTWTPKSCVTIGRSRLSTLLSDPFKKYEPGGQEINEAGGCRQLTSQRIEKLQRSLSFSHCDPILQERGKGARKKGRRR